ncbi:hypothetical protein LMH73_004550 [Vibrio splendidus]|nr:hypothetical protein [Vibrio splendidus]MCC4883296.1 hypothetical protein [Vibrio splendidus]
MNNKVAPIAIAIGAILTISGFGYNHMQSLESTFPNEAKESKVQSEQADIKASTIDSKYTLGKHYTELPVAFPQYEGKIVSFLWYGCHACSSVKPHLDKFNESKDVIVNKHMSRNANDFQANLFFALEHLDRSDLHADITDLGSSGKLVSEADYFNYLESNNLPMDTVKEAMALDSVKAAQQLSGEEFFAAGFTGTPSFIINGKYQINMGEMKTWQDITGVLEHVYQTEMKKPEAEVNTEVNAESTAEAEAKTEA